MSNNTFPKSGYHSGFHTTNRHSIFELVEPDQMYTVGVPAIISEGTRYLIKKVVDNWLFEQSNLRSLTEFDPDDGAPYGWDGVLTKKTDECPYVGTFVKRVASHYWKAHQIKLSQDVMSKIGNLAGKDSKVNEFYLRFDPIANYRRGNFGDDDSCFWGDRQMARVQIRNEGGCFVEFYDGPNARIYNGDVSGGRGLGRCWIIPIDQWTDYDEQIFLLCNVYANHIINKYNATRAVASVLGMTYRYHNHVNSNSGVFYINGDCGMVIGADPEHVLDVCSKPLDMVYDSAYDKMGRGDPELSFGSGFRPYIDPDDDDDDRYYCDRCGHYVDDDDWVADLDMCEECASENHSFCDRCNEWFSNDDRVEYNGYIYCQDCASRDGIERCENCEEYRRDVQYYDDLNMSICESCFEDEYAVCKECDTVQEQSEMYPLEGGEWVCSNCIEDGIKDEYFKCTFCHKIKHIREMDTDLAHHEVCALCAPVLIHCPSCHNVANVVNWRHSELVFINEGDSLYTRRIWYTCPTCGQERINNE